MAKTHYFKANNANYIVTCTSFNCNLEKLRSQLIADRLAWEVSQV